MKNIYSNFTKNWLYLLIVGAISFLFLAAFIYYLGVKNSNIAATQFETIMKNQLKQLVKTEVLNRINEIDYELNQIIKEEKKLTKKKIDHLNELLLSSNIINIKNGDERKKAAIKEYERLAKVDPEYIYFILDTKGTLLYSGLGSEYKDVNQWNVRNEDGIYPAREVAKAKEESEGIYVSYNWPKVKNGKTYRKTSYCLYVPEFDFIIGTGSYDVDVYERLKERTYDRIQKYYENKDNYIFILSYDGTTLVHANPEYVNKKISSLNSPELNKVHDILRKQALSGNGFVTYKFNKKDSNEVNEKISYIHNIDSWNVYMGMGSHTDDVVKEIKLYSDIFKKNYLKDTVSVFSILIIIALITTFFTQHGLKIQKEVLKQEDIVFEQLLQLINDGVIIISKNGKKIYSNEIIHKIFKDKVEIIFNSNIDNYLKNLHDNIYLFKNNLGREYFIKMNIQEMIYLGDECKLFIIENITEQYIRENELQKMAYYDVLTNLPNRRKFLNDFEDILLSNLENEKENEIILSILDLDNFKDINDKYGHDRGDDVLRSFGEVVGRSIRESEGLYRFGGEEFIIVFQHVSLEKVRFILESVNKKFSEYLIRRFGFSVTFSAGAVDIDLNSDPDIASSLKKADKLLYQAKAKGRNRIEIKLDE